MNVTANLSNEIRGCCELLLFLRVRHIQTPRIPRTHDARTYRHGSIDALHIGFVHQNFSRAQAQRLDFALAQVLAPLEPFNLFVEAGIATGRGQPTGRHVGGPLVRCRMQDRIVVAVAVESSRGGCGIGRGYDLAGRHDAFFV